MSKIQTHTDFPCDQNPLSVIGCKKFTKREIDVISCISKQKDAAIASLLSISSLEVQDYIQTIMLKIGCHSREEILDFVQQSDAFPLVVEHYRELVIHSIFEKALKQITPLMRHQEPRCIMISKEFDTDEEDVVQKRIQKVKRDFEDDFERVGVKFLDKINPTLQLVSNTILKDGSLANIPVDSSQGAITIVLISKHHYQVGISTLQNESEEDMYEQPIFVELKTDEKKAQPLFLVFESFYHLILEVLENLYPEKDLQNITQDFYYEYQALYDETVLPTHMKQSPDQGNLIHRIYYKIDRSLNYWQTYAILFCVIVVGVISISAFFSRGKDVENEYSRVQKNSIRSN